MIINIRGTSGSGKTYMVRAFMEKYGPDSVILLDSGKTAAHCVYYRMLPVFFLGSYKNICGGTDSIPTQDLICSLVRHFSQFGHVVFEGLILSHLYARYVALYNEMVGYNEKMVIAYMDTPLDLCIERVKQRRLEKGNTRELDPKNTINQYTSTLSTMTKFKADGMDVRWIKHDKDPVKQLRVLLKEDDKFGSFESNYREESFR